MSNDRQEKKDLFTEKEKKGSGVVAFVIIGLLIAVAAGGWLVFTQSSDAGFPSLKSQNGEVRIDLKNVGDGKAHYFSYNSHGTDVDFFVVKSVDGVMRAAFDACDVCYREKKGYRQEGNFMVCNNCDMRFRTDMVNEVKGGCNPSPLNRHIDGDEIVIRTADINAGSWYFKQ